MYVSILILKQSGAIVLVSFSVPPMVSNQIVSVVCANERRANIKNKRVERYFIIERFWMVLNYRN